MFLALIGTMGKDIGRFYKHNRPKSSSPTLKKPVLLSSANHISCITISNQPVTSHPCQHKGSASNQDKVNISNTDDIHSCVTPKRHNISVQATSTSPRLTPLITTLPLLPVELPKTTQLTPLGKEYLCSQVDNKSPHAAQCVKSRVLKKVIDSILSINNFEQQCVVIKCLLQSSRLENHMKTIGIDQYSVARSSSEHRFMNNIKKIYQHAGKCDDQQNLKDIIDAAILSTTEGVKYNSPNVHMTSKPVKKPSARKSLYLFTNIVAVKPTTAKHRFVAAKSRRKSMKVCNNLWTKKKTKRAFKNK